MKKINFRNQDAVFAKRLKLRSSVIGEGYVLQAVTVLHFLYFAYIGVHILTVLLHLYT